MKDDAADLGAVRGERDASSLSQTASIQSRLSSVLAIALMSVLGLGMLTWYYAHAMTRQTRAHENAQTAAAKRAQGEAPLPSLGRIDQPRDIATPPTAPPLNPTSLREIPLEAAPPMNNPATPPAKTPAQLLLERQLSGVAYSAQGLAPQGTAAPVIPTQNPVLSWAAPHEGADLGALLHPTMTEAVRAQVLPTQRLLLPKGAFIDCTLETAIDSTLPGMTTCVMATDAFGVDGQVVLLERGTKLVGETRGEVQQGSARVFVLWSEARTPRGVIVPLASPGADELGRSGLSGKVDHHFWQRFGAAMLVSVIDGAVQAAAQSGRGTTSVVINPAASQDVMTEILKGTINIPPTVVKHQGDRIQILVARDVDFRSVYELRASTNR